MCVKEIDNNNHSSGTVRLSHKFTFIYIFNFIYMKTTELIRTVDRELQEDFWGRTSKIENEIKKYLKRDNVSLRWSVSLNRVREELEDMDWDFIFSNKKVYWVEYAYMWGVEVGSV